MVAGFAKGLTISHLGTFHDWAPSKTGDIGVPLQGDQPGTEPRKEPKPEPETQAVSNAHLAHAIVELQAAKIEIIQATHDFGGARAQALTDIDVAIIELQRALVYEQKREEIKALKKAERELKEKEKELKQEEKQIQP